MRKFISLMLSLALLFLTACGIGDAPEAPAPSPTPTLTPTPAPTPTPDPVSVRTEELMAGMSLRDKLCQLIIVRPERLADTEEALTTSGESVRSALETYPVGGIIYTAKHLVSMEQTRQMVAGAQSYSSIPLFICADEEGGRVARLMLTIGTTRFGPMFSYRELGTGVAYNNAFTIGTDMLSAGFNTDFAPVADVWTNPANTVIGDRAYSDDPKEAAELVAAAVTGYRDSGCICCLKHFPGHGDTAADTHIGPAVSEKTAAELAEAELLPFISGIAAGADMVMAGHITLPAIDNQPASISHKIITGMLRGELGFEGVIITDGLDMGALDDYTDGQKCVLCLEAGCDILLGVSDIEGALQELEAAVAEGTLTEQRIDESVLRVLRLKLTRGIITE